MRTIVTTDDYKPQKKVVAMQVSFELQTQKEYVENIDAGFMLWN